MSWPSEVYQYGDYSQAPDTLPPIVWHEPNPKSQSKCQNTESVEDMRFPVLRLSTENKAVNDGQLRPGGRPSRPASRGENSYHPLGTSFPERGLGRTDHESGRDIWRTSSSEVRAGVSKTRHAFPFSLPTMIMLVINITPCPQSALLASCAHPATPSSIGLL